MRNKPNIRIVPIFNQKASPKIWSDFTKIELLCDSVKYGYIVEITDESRIHSNHIKVWKEKKYNFAFAAYDGSKMVGFANGFLVDKHESFLRNLYVRPEYNGMGIGKELLRKSENTASLISQDMSIVSLSGAVGFYEGCGYKSYDNRNMVKALPCCAAGVVPVFEATLTNMRAKIKLDYDKSLVKQCRNQPIFVYVNYDNEIDAIGIQTPDKEIKIWTNLKKSGMKDFYERKLLSALSKVR